MAKRLVKVRFPLDAEEWHAHAGEFLWASPVSEVDRVFRIENTPYFTKGISFHDVVKARTTEDKVIFEFDEVVERGGNSTYMLLVRAEEPRFKDYWTFLAKLGCSYERMEIELSMGPRLLLAVDVPSSANSVDVWKLLAKGEADGVWTFQQGYSHQVPA